MLAMTAPGHAQTTSADPAVTAAPASDAPQDASAPVASAQRAKIAAGQAADDGDAPEVVVTGTRIQRPNVKSAAPITSVTAQQIGTQQPLNVEEVLNRLPQVAPDSQQNYSDGDGAQRIKLRSLGFERTLVLVDGKRLGTVNGEDANIIPPSLLERVDVLTGGASSVYGSDAIAGVVNFILKKDFTGLQIDAGYNFYNHDNRDTLASGYARSVGLNSPTGFTNDGGRADLTVTAGTKLFDDRLKVSGFFSYKHTDYVPYTDRSSSPCYLTMASNTSPITCAASSYTTTGTIIPESGANAGTLYINGPAGSGTFQPFGTGPLTNAYSVRAAQRGDSRYNAGGMASFEITPAVELYGTALWFRDHSYAPYPLLSYGYTSFGSTPYQVNCNNPFLSSSQATTLGCAAGSTASVPLDVRYRFGDGNLGLAPDRWQSKGIRATAGLRGQFGGAWNYDVGGVYARNQKNWLTGSYSDPDRINRSLNVVSVNGTPTCVSAIDGSDPACVPFNAFTPGQNDTSLINYLYGTYSGGKSKTVQTLTDGLATLSGDLGHYGITSPLADQGVAIAFSAEYRKDKLVSSSNAAYNLQYGDATANLQQHVWEGSVELQAPLVEHKRFVDLLQWNGAYRVSKYSTNPDRFSTWKTEGLWSPVSDITFRASYNRAQRAPTVVEAQQATRVSYGTQGGTQGDFCAPTVITDATTGAVTYGAPAASQAVCAATGLPSNLYGSKTLLCPDNACTVKYGGFTVDPETAYTISYGLILKPRFIKGLVFSVDRYKIKILNSIGYNDYDYYYNGCLISGGNSFFCSNIVRNPDGTLYSAANTNPTTGFFRGGTTNYYRSYSNGYDFQATYALGLGRFGRLDWDFDGSLTTMAGSKDSPILPKRNCAGYYGNGCGQLIPRWVHQLGTTYSTSNGLFSATFNWRYIGSLTNANNSGDAAIGGTDATALTSFYHISPQNYFDLAFVMTFEKKLVLRLSMNNVFDKIPPILPNSYSTSLDYNNTIPQRYDSLGRQIALSASVKF